MKIHSALESAGVEFIDENGGGPGVSCQDAGRARSHLPR
jgi:hypothetical protein